MAKGLTLHRVVVMMFSSSYVVQSIFGLLTMITVGAVFSIIGIPLTSFVIGGIASLVLFALGFIGIYALVKEDSRKMKIFGILVVISIIIMLLLLIFIAVGLFMVVDNTNDSFKYAMETYNTSSISRKSVDSTQVYLKCCGMSSYSDWGSHVPFSCCKDLVTTETCDVFNEVGCDGKRNKLMISGTSILIPYICLIAFHVFTAKYSFILANEFKYPENKP